MSSILNKSQKYYFTCNFLKNQQTIFRCFNTELSQGDIDSSKVKCEVKFGLQIGPLRTITQQICHTD